MSKYLRAINKVFLVSTVFLPLDAFAVQFAFCTGDLKGRDLSCFKQSEFGDNIVIVEKSVGEMYSKGWRLISTSAFERVDGGRKVEVYYYFDGN